MADNDTDFVLQEKFRNPTSESSRTEDNWKWEWATPIKIQRDGTIHLNGLLDTENAVSTENLKDSAVTTNKIDSKAITKDKIALGAVDSDQIAPGAVNNNKIANGTITFDKLDMNSKIPSSYLDVGSILQESSVDVNNNIRPITANTIRRGAIVHSKLFNSEENLEGIGIDDQPPVWGENIKDQAIAFNHMSNPRGIDPVNEEGKYPISGVAHIQKRSIPLNRLSEPIFTLQKMSDDEYILNFYPINGDAVLFNGSSTIESWQQGVIDCNTIINSTASQTEIDSAEREKEKYERWIANANNAYYIDIYDTDFNWDTTFYEGE